MTMRIGIDIGSDTVKTVILDEDGSIRTLPIVSIQGQPLRRVQESLRRISLDLDIKTAICGVTGSGAGTLSGIIHTDAVHEPNALGAALDRLYPEVRTIIEMGRESQKYILFERDPTSGKLLVEDSNLGNKCASGSGSFLDHIGKRLNYSSIQEFAHVALETTSPANLSGRCAVFTESDIVHLYQKGTPRERIAAGVHLAVSRNYRSAIARGKDFIDKVIFVGGVSENPAAVKYLSEELGLDGRLTVPEHNRTLGAIGAALQARHSIDLHEAIEALKEQIAKPLEYPGSEPIHLTISEIMPPVAQEDIPRDIERAALGVDIGSVSTKAALVTEVGGKFVVLASYYRRTDGDPLAAVSDTLANIHQQARDSGYRIGSISAATTGSGRYLTGDYIGADLIRNEITAQASGACFYASDVDAIFEIGGQDSKYIRLDGDVITDFEMNKACAAGTGAFLEKQALRLGIALEDFGDTALANTRPPELDWTCTVFSESAMVYYQQNSVPTPDLAAGICLASVKNFLNKNVASREIGGKIAFQGAVAFNKGMVAAFETVLGRKIVVPPYPHITGAIGAARLAYLANPAKPLFHGFESIAKSTYEITSFECKSCPNRCDVNTFCMENGPRYYYNDRCEKFSAVQKNIVESGMPDLFAEREEFLMSSVTGVPFAAGTQVPAAYAGHSSPAEGRVGIPRGLMFSEYYPLYASFFTNLGYEVIPSDPTNKRIIDMGLDSAMGEPCYPYKVAHGHHLDVIDKGVDIIFSPGVINTEQPNSNLHQAQTCPYLQGAPDVINGAIGITERGIRLISPMLHFKRGRRAIERAFMKVGNQLGKSPKATRTAFGVGWKALEDFRAKLRKRGEEVIKNLPPDQMAFVVIGRPYTLYDPVLNMHIGKKIQDLGYLAIPQDYLPLDSVDISDSWPNAYSRQIQKKLMAARLIKKDARLRAVVLTYFACGPDSFGNPFFKDELGEPCYVMQLDEHTADAGVITRIEAFADTAGKGMGRDTSGVRSQDTSIFETRDRKIWVPYANDASRVLAATLRGFGFDADALPVSPDSGLNLARKAISEDVCLPSLMTTEDMLYRISQPDFDPKREAFFQGNAEGPCRYGMYSMLQRRILDKLGYPEVPVVTLGAKSNTGGMGINFAIVAWDGFVCHDILFKMLLKVRPYEVQRGTADRVFDRYMTRLLQAIPIHKERVGKAGLGALLNTKQLEPLEELLRDAQRDFSTIPKRLEERPLVGVVGEFFVRLHEGANQDILRKLEAEGAETWLAPATEFFAYSNYIGKVLAEDRFKEMPNLNDLKALGVRALNAALATRHEHTLFEAALPLLDGYDDIGPAEVIENGARYVNYNFGGEAICSIGKSDDFARRGLSGIVSVIPFNCMPGNTVTSLSHSLRRRYDNIPFLNLDYDGFVDNSREAKMINFMWQVKERFNGRKYGNEAEATDAVAHEVGKIG